MQERPPTPWRSQRLPAHLDAFRLCRTFLSGATSDQEPDLNSSQAAQGLARGILDEQTSVLWRRTELAVYHGGLHSAGDSTRAQRELTEPLGPLEVTEHLRLPNAFFASQMQQSILYPSARDKVSDFFRFGDTPTHTIPLCLCPNCARLLKSQLGLPTWASCLSSKDLALGRFWISDLTIRDAQPKVRVVEHILGLKATIIL